MREDVIGRANVEDTPELDVGSADDVLAHARLFRSPIPLPM